METKPRKYHEAGIPNCNQIETKNVLTKKLN